MAQKGLMRVDMTPGATALKFQFGRGGCRVADMVMAAIISLWQPAGSSVDDILDWVQVSSLLASQLLVLQPMQHGLISGQATWNFRVLLAGKLHSHLRAHLMPGQKHNGYLTL